MCLELCMKTNTGYGGKAIESPKMAANWEECAYRCLQKETCVAWVLVPKDYPANVDNYAKCHIKGPGNWNPHPGSGFITGLKDCITGTSLHFHVLSSLSFFFSNLVSSKNTNFARLAGPPKNT